MRLHHIVALVTSLALTGGLLFLAGETDVQETEAVDVVVATSEPSTTTIIRAVRVLSESPPTIAPDTDLDGNPVGDHYGATTTTFVATATAPVKPRTQSSSSPTTTSTTASPASGVEAHFDSAAEASFASKINGLRSSNGRPALSRSSSLDSEARSWARTLGDKGKLSHSTIGRLLPPWSAAAENVGTGGSVDVVFGALAGSDGHRSNMLGDYTHLGIGVWIDSDGRLWTVQVFAR